MLSLKQRLDEILLFFQKRARLTVALFWAVLLLAGLLVSGDYGLPFDEPAEQHILQENLSEYAFQLWGPGSEPSVYYGRLGVERISQSIERDHGQSAYYLAAPLLGLASSAPDAMTTLWHAYTWLWFMAGVLAIYAFGREMGWSRPISCFSALLLYLSPRFFAEGHYNNKDMVLLSLFLLTLWLGLRLLHKPGYLRGLLFSLAGAMAANTKIVGLMPWGLVGLCAIAMVTAQKGWCLRMWGVLFSTIAGFAVFYILLTPALWASPAEYLAYVLQNASGFSRWKGIIIYRGMFIDQQKAPIPRMYLPTMMVATMPLYTFPLAALGQLKACFAVFGAVRRQKTSPLRSARFWMLPILSLCWFLPLFYAMVARPIVYNSWRHFYFVYAGCVLLAGYGTTWLAEWLGRKPRGKALLSAALCLCLAVSAMGIITNHPYQYVYYNPLARKTAATDMELDYWTVSAVNAMEQLAQYNIRNESLPLALGSRDELCRLALANGYSVLPQEARSRLTITEDEHAPYLLLNTTYARIMNIPPPEGYAPLFTLEAYGNVFCTVYERSSAP